MTLTPDEAATVADWDGRGLSLDHARRRSVMLGFPVYDKPHPQHEAAAMGTVALLSRLGIHHGWCHIAGQPIHTARNLLVGAFLESDFTDLMFIDADMSWSPLDIVRLLAQPHPFIGGVGRKRNDTPDTDLRAWCFQPLDDQPAHDPSGAFAVAMIGTGFLLLNRKVFRTLEAHGGVERVTQTDGLPYPRFFRWRFRDGYELSEDYGFCEDYRAAGGTVMVDPTIELSHFGHQNHKARLHSLLA